MLLMCFVQLLLKIALLLMTPTITIILSVNKTLTSSLSTRIARAELETIFPMKKPLEIREAFFEGTKPQKVS